MVKNLSIPIDISNFSDEDQKVPTPITYLEMRSKLDNLILVSPTENVVVEERSDAAVVSKTWRVI